MFLLKPHQDIHSSLTFNCLPTNCLGGKPERLNFEALVLTPNALDDGWIVVDRISFHNMYTVIIRSENYDMSVGSILVVVPVAIGMTLPKQLKELPIPFKRELDMSSFTSRGSLRFHYRNASSSYQSEYPLEMASRVEGRTTTFNFLANSTEQQTTHLACFVNIQRLNRLNAKCIKVEYFTDSRSSSGLLTFQPNSAGIWEKVGNIQIEIFAFNSTNALSIPIFISFTQSQFPQITVEHTHPPAEYFWGNHARKSGLSRIRRTWSTK